MAVLNLFLIQIIMIILIRQTSSFLHYIKTNSRTIGSSSIHGKSCIPAKVTLNNGLLSEEDLKEKYEIPVSEEHPRTIEYAEKHFKTFKSFLNYHKISNHTKDSFSKACEFVNEFYEGKEASRKGVIIDSGCGTGLSTLRIAEIYPNTPVIGIDKSIVRLQKNKIFKNILHESSLIVNDNSDESSNYADSDNIKKVPSRENMLLLRADLVDLWLLVAIKSDWIVEKHFILYPNPYPKAQHLMRRWHGHPVFPAVIALGGQLTLRSSWNIYCTEFLQAVHAIRTLDQTQNLLIKDQCDDNAHSRLAVTEFIPGVPISNFEKKYHDVGVPLYELQIPFEVRSPSERRSLLRRWLF